MGETGGAAATFAAHVAWSDTIGHGDAVPPSHAGALAPGASALLRQPYRPRAPCGRSLLGRVACRDTRGDARARPGWTTADRRVIVAGRSPHSCHPMIAVRAAPGQPRPTTTGESGRRRAARALWGDRLYQEWRCGVLVFLVAGCLLSLWRWFRHRAATRGPTPTARKLRMLHPRTPEDCPCCRVQERGQQRQEPDPAPVRPWREGVPRRGRPRRITTQGYACPLCWPFGSSMHLMSVRGAPARRPSLR